MGRAGTDKAYHVLVRGLRAPVVLHVEHVDARPRGVRADRERWERQRRGLARQGDVRPVYRNLQEVVRRVEEC